MSKRHVTTKRHFALFKAECERCIAAWGINDWSVTIVHEKMADCRAQFRSKIVQRGCTLSLNTEWTEKDGNGDEHYAPTDERVLYAARHEVTHLLLADLSEIADERFLTRDEYVSAVERTVRRVQRLLP